MTSQSWRQILLLVSWDIFATQISKLKKLLKYMFIRYKDIFEIWILLLISVTLEGLGWEHSSSWVFRY